MGYSSGMLNKRITIARRKDDATETFGKNGHPKYEILGTFWASETFNKGVKSLREGAFDAYDTVMFRMRHYPGVDRWCLIQYHGKWYQIQSFNEDYQDNQIQITAIEMANQKVNLDYLFLADKDGNLIVTTDVKYIVLNDPNDIVFCADKNGRLLMTKNNKFIVSKK